MYSLNDTFEAHVAPDRGGVPPEMMLVYPVVMPNGVLVLTGYNKPPPSLFMLILTHFTRFLSRLITWQQIAHASNASTQETSGNLFDVHPLHKIDHAFFHRQNFWRTGAFNRLPYIQRTTPTNTCPVSNNQEWWWKSATLDQVYDHWADKTLE